MPNKKGLPAIAPEGILFALKDIAYSPETPRLEEPFVVKGKVELFGIPFLAPIWVIAKVTAPETWWEHYIPIWGSPTVGESQTALGGDFEIKFPRGFDREGEFLLDVEVHAGPTFTVDKMTIPPFPPLASQAMTFIVGGEVPPEETGFQNFRITGYSKNGGPVVPPPGVLELDMGDRCRVHVAFAHRLPAAGGKFHAAIWQKTIWDPHNEVLSVEKVFTVPSSTDWTPWEGYIDIPITSAISPGSEYGLYVKIMGITGGDIFTPYLANVITIVGPPPVADIRNFNFQLTRGTYDVGDTVPWASPYEYAGPAQSGRLTISIGTGIYPTFNPVHTYAPVTINFEEALSWTARALQGNITLPSTLQPGQTYSVRAKLETTTYPTQETDTDWSAFDITAAPEMEILEVKIEPLGAGYVTTSPAPSGGVQHNWQFPHGTTVYVTAHPNAGYVFDSWSGEMTDTTAITAPVYSMTEHRLITAHFREKEVPEEYEGTISKKELEYNGIRGAIPVSSVPLDKRGLVHIWGRNDMNSTQKMGIWWQVKDPDGIMVEEYARWEAFWTGPGNAQEFIGGRFDLDKAGTYTIAVQLFMNPDDQVVVADYYGTLCTVAGAPPPTAISFGVMLWGTGGFGSPDSWWCDYWDPGINNFVGDKKWHKPYEDIPFSNVQSGGYLAVFLLRNSTVSSQFSSPTFEAVDGGRYQYDLDLNRVSKIG